MRRGPGLVGMAARTAVVAGTATAVSGRTARRQQQKYASRTPQYNAAAGSGRRARHGAGGAGPAPAAEDPFEQIEKLSKLHDSGALTDEEFAAAKAKILGT